MVQSLQTWGIREFAILIYALVWSAVTILFAVRGVAIVEGTGWWAGLPGGIALIWKIFAPQTPPTGGQS